MSVQHRGMMTAVDRITYDFQTRTGVVYMPPLCCTDMTGAIRSFMRIDPSVECIVTVAGDVEDNVYVHGPAGWYSTDV